MKQMLFGWLMLLVCCTVQAQESRFKSFPPAQPDLFRTIQLSPIQTVLQEELPAMLSGMELNEKIREQWHIQSTEQLRQLRYQTILPVLSYHAANDRAATLENPDLFYVPLYDQNEIRLVAAIGKINGSYHIYQLGWPVVARSLNQVKHVFNSGKQLCYVEMLDTNSGALLSVTGDELRASGLQVEQLVMPGEQTTPAKKPITFVALTQQPIL